LVAVAALTSAPVRAAAPPSGALPLFDDASAPGPGLASIVSPSARRLTLRAGAADALRGASTTRVRIPFSGGRDLDLDLTRVPVLSSDAVVTVTDDRGAHPLPVDLVAFGGTVVGEARSWVVLTLSGGEAEGVISIADQRWTLGPQRPRRGAVASTPSGGVAHLLENENDLPSHVGRFECGADELEALSKPAVDIAPPGDVTAAAVRRVCRVAIDCDYEFFNGKFGGNATAGANYVLTLMALVSLIYERDLDTAIEVSYLNLWSTPSDPYTQTTTSGQLPEFRDYWNANRGSVSRKLAHLFSGRDLGGGIAYLDVLCNPGSAYAVSQLDAVYEYPSASSTWDAMVTAHEMGHNFRSRHTHSCYWQDQGLVPAATLIDSCYTAEGTCYAGPTGILPAAGKGTIMSYCHLINGVAGGIRLDFHPACRIVMRAAADACLPTVAKQPPGLLTATPSGATVHLSWEPSPLAGVTSYDLVRGAIQLDPAAPLVATTPATSYIDDNILGTYYYKVRARSATDTTAFDGERAVTVCAPLDPQYFAAGTAVLAPTLVDLNRDGIEDIIVANNLSGGTVSVLMGQGTGGAWNGTFAAPAVYPAGSRPVAIATGDVDDDGLLDLVVANNGTTGTWSVLRGQGAGGLADGTFGAPATYPAASKASAVVVRDFNEDGMLDVAVASNGGSLVHVYHGLGTNGAGTGTFGDSTAYSVDLRPVAMAAGDFNGDGILDLAVVSNGSGSVCILRGLGAAGIGDGTFGDRVSYPVGTGANGLALGDLNGDGITDVVVARTLPGGQVAVLWGHGSGGVGDGTFEPAQSYPAGVSCNAVAIADVNGNGAPDVVVSNGGGTISVLLGQAVAGVPTGTLGDAQSFDAGAGPQGIAVADLDQDGRADVIVSKTGALDNLGVRRGACSAGAPASLVLTAPNGGETWPIRSERTVSWTKGPGVGAVDVEVSRDGGLHWETIATDQVGTQVTWTVTPPTSAPASALVRVRDAVFFARSDASNAPFVIVPPTVAVGGPATTSFGLIAAAPSHAGAALAVRFALATREAARLDLVDIAGRRVGTRAVGGYGPGAHVVTLEEARGLASGLYFVRLVQGSRSAAMKALVTH
jgi:hypothetical protein